MIISKKQQFILDNKKIILEKNKEDNKLPNLNNNIVVFTDGSFSAKNNRCGYGVFFLNDNFKSNGHKLKYQPLTNNRAELYAVLSALKMIRITLNNNKNDFKKIIFFVDSAYTINCYTRYPEIWKKNNWINTNNEEVKNQDIIKNTLLLIDEIKKKYKIDIDFNHVKSHTKCKDSIHLSNDVVDKLATGLFK